jgi:guanylate kinase
VHGNLYATPKAPVEEALGRGEDMLFDIDWQGARQLKAHMAAAVVSVFILPPDGKALERRLKTRNQDSTDVMQRRLAAAATEIEHWDEYDYVIVNSEVETSLAMLTHILAAERLRRVRQTGMAKFVRKVLASF